MESTDQQPEKAAVTEAARNKEFEMRAKLNSLLESHGVDEYAIVYKNNNCLGLTSNIKRSSSIHEFAGTINAFAMNQVLKNMELH